MSLVRNGRVLLYPAEILLNTDLLRMEIFRRSDVACLAQAILGYGISNSTLASGLNCTVTSPPSLGVSLAPGAIFSLEEFDSVAYPPSGGLPADTSDMLYVPGINLESTTISSLTPPSTPGDSIAYLIEAQWATQDTEPTTRQYYNPSNPPTPITTSANDVRTDYVFFQVKASSPAPSPVIPTPDAGFVGLWVVTVPQGASVVNSGMIAQYSGAPFISETLTQKLSYKNFQNSAPIYGIDSSGAANTITVNNTTPAYTQIVAGTIVCVKMANSNTSSTIININSLGTKNVYKQTASGLLPLSGGELIVGLIYQMQYDGSQFQLLTTSTSAEIPVGMIMDYAGVSSPAGFLDCDGSAISRTTYASLFSAIGTTWGVGDGSTTFNIPDFRRRTAVGSGGSGTGELGNAVGNTGGEESHTQTEAELAAHSHPGSVAPSAAANAVGTNLVQYTGNSTPTFNAPITIATDGSSTPFNVIQPSAVTLKCIKY